jgi:colanic acid/amylovoran biosynthesis glycosyltransferase
MKLKHSRKRIAYIVSRFPKITETFIMFEILELERLGTNVSVFSVLRENEGIMHAEAASIVERAHYCKLFSWAVLRSQIFWLWRSQAAYLRAWRCALSGNARSPNFFLRALYIVPIAAHFARQMQEEGIEHVHANWATHPALAADVSRMLAGIPYSFTAHSHEIYVDRTMLGEKIRQSEFFLTISEYNRRLLTELYGSECAAKMHVIHCGVDTSLFKPRNTVRANQRFTIICVASLENHKGQKFLIEACAELRRRGVDFRCLLVGEGEDRSLLERQIRELGLDQCVQILGRQPRHRVLELMAEADVLTLQSIMTPSGMSEGIPVSLMEAMASGVPVIASSIRGIPELVEHGRAGLLVPHSDAHALAEALMTIYTSPALARELAIRGREMVVREFDLTANTIAKQKLFAGVAAADDQPAEASQRASQFHLSPL